MLYIFVEVDRLSDLYSYLKIQSISNRFSYLRANKRWHFGKLSHIHFLEEKIIIYHFKVFETSMLRTVFLLSLIVAVRCSTFTLPSADASTISPIISYLQGESSSLATAQHTITSFLRSKKIPIGDAPRSLRPAKESDTDQSKLRIALSRKNNSIECRVALGKAPIGSKLIAPW